jgi:hypothetical protein
MNKTVTIVSLLKRFLTGNKSNRAAVALAVVAIVLLRLHDIDQATFTTLIGMAVSLVGFANKAPRSTDVPVDSPDGAPAPSAQPALPGVLGALGGLLMLTGVATSCASHFAPHLGLATPPLALVASSQAVAALDSFPVPPYLAAPPAGLTKRQERQFRRAQRRGLIEASRVVPAKLKVSGGSAYNAAPDGTAVALHKPGAAVGIGPAAQPTDNRNVGRNANGGVSAGHGAAPATGAAVPPKPGLLARLWGGVQKYALTAVCIVVVLAFFGGLAWLRLSPFGRGLRAAAAATRAAVSST